MGHSIDLFLYLNETKSILNFMIHLLKFLKKFQRSSYDGLHFSFLFILLFFTSGSSAQDQHTIDSLQKLLPTITIDSTKINVLNDLSSEVVDIDPTKSINYATEALRLAETLKLKKGAAKALHNIGNGHYNLAEYKIALSYYIRALNIQEAIGNKKGILSSSGAIGNVFLDLDQPDEAFKYFKQALAISKELNSKSGMAASLVAIGHVYSDKEDFKQALEYIFQSVKLFEEIGNKEAVGTCYNNIADAYQHLKEPAKAMYYVNKAYDQYHEVGNVYGMALALNNIGNFYQQTGNQEKALEYFKRGLEQAQKIGANERILSAYEGISKTYKALGRYKEALAINELHQQMNDSIYNTESSKQIAEMQARFDTEKKAKEIDILTKDKKLKEEELLKQRLISWSMAIGGCLLLLLALLAIRGYIQKRK
jgi:tetratricopeptide (TPR) repeat protein